MPKKSRYIEILEAASRIVQTKGVFSLTLDAVAKEAGVSKGGLLYHFPSKEALVTAMVEHVIDDYVENIKQRAEADTGEKGKWTRAIVMETYEQTFSNLDINAGFLVALAMDPKLLGPIQKAYEDWQEKIEADGIDPVNATILRLAVDGLWLSELLGLKYIDEDLQQRIYQRLLSQTEDGADSNNG
ncbi:TetR/AcrR family transcriptional regulator [Desertibacillus haloalkaliphilus]|uniref:TetR/AcrR family transcriptional regulator n=1 Tax=Desertibacillus haloalkaliphilus TaxID=1328930 RepID=UPI001C25659E|nr:TetR/AcrR family transcriptional regulator [Desertibacillus haloalkaliphilus]MBU8906801.1 TetR/AcrR family transcriptional regulator [Desertibacillus haloalkaliphilus]